MRNMEPCDRCRKKLHFVNGEWMKSLYIKSGASCRLHVRLCVVGILKKLIHTSLWWDTTYVKIVMKIRRIGGQ